MRQRRRDRPDEQRRVCVIRQFYFPQDVRVRREVEALSEQGYRVDVLCLALAGQPRNERLGSVEVHRLNMMHRRGRAERYLLEYGAFFLWAFAKASRMHARHRYRLVQVHTVPDALVFAAAFPKLLGASIILDMHEVMPELFASKFGDNRTAVRLLELVERLSASFADRVLTVSRPTWKVLVGRGVPPRKLEIVMNTPDDRIFTPSDGSLAPRHNSDAGLTLVSHGALIERYGYQTILQALKEIRESHPQVRLLIMGHGEYEATLRELVRELALEKNVEILGFKPLEEVVDILRSADIGVTANTNDIFTQLIVPTKLMEYVALGIPAVVSRLPAVEDYFDETMVNFFDPDDPQDLASVICSVADDLGKARATAQRTRERFLAEYGWTKMKARYLQVVDALVDVP